MRTSMTLASNQNISVFELMREDTDEVIEILNFYITIGNSKDNHARDIGTTKNQTQQRIKVNDATATGGWF